MTQPESPDALPETPPAIPADAAEAAVETPAPEPEPEPWTPRRVSEWNSYYDMYVAIGVLLLAFIVSSNKISHSSIWTQLRAGEVIATKHKPVVTDIFSYTEAGRPWANIPWLFEWGHALIYKAGSELVPIDRADPASSSRKAEQVGAAALVAVNALARALTVLVLLGIRRPGPGLWWSAVAATLALGVFVGPLGLMLGGIAGPGVVAPGTWGLLLLAIELFLLHRAIDLGRPAVAFALVPLFVLWANLDESFLIGLIVLAASAIGRFVPARGEPAEALSPTRALILLGVCAAACLVNPSVHRAYGAALHPFRQLFAPAGGVLSMENLSYFGSSIPRGEVRGEDVRKLLMAYYLLAVGLGVASFVLNRRRFSLGRFLSFAALAVCWGALLRFAPEFSIVFAVSLALNGQEWYHDRFGTEGKLGQGWAVWSTGGRFVTILLVFLCLAQDLTGYGRAIGEPRFGFGFNPDDFAFEAGDYLRTAPIRGNVLNTSLLQGDSLIWRAYPLRKTFIDGRQDVFPPEIQKLLRDTRLALAEDRVEEWKPVFDRYQIVAVMIQVETAPRTYGRLMQSLNWIPFYDDGSVVMFGRSDASREDVAYFKANRLDPEAMVYSQTHPVPPTDRPPTPVTRMDEIFQNRLLDRSQPHTESSKRWLESLATDRGASALPDPARCILAIREARTALARKPDDPMAYRLLAVAYRGLLIQESALLSGLKLTPKDRARAAQARPRPDLLMNRFRQYATSLNFAIQTTPPPKSTPERRELIRLNIELAQLSMSRNHSDLARDRFKAALKLGNRSDFPDEVRARMDQDVGMLDDRVKQIQEGMSDLVSQQQAGPIQRADYALAQGAPGLAIQELEEALQINVSPAVVKPKLLDLYCDTGQPERALELLGGGNVEDPTLGIEPGTSALRQGRVYALLGNYEYAATLWQRNAIPQLRFERTFKVLNGGRSLLRGEFKSTNQGVLGAIPAFLATPSKITTQAVWLNDLALCLLESGQPTPAADAFTQALTLAPNLSTRPIAAYYLEKLGKPVPKREGETKPAGKETKPEKPAESQPPGETPEKGKEDAATPEKEKAEAKATETPEAPKGETKAPEKPEADKKEKAEGKTREDEKPAEKNP